MTTGRSRADSSREDELLSGLSRQVTEPQGARFAAGHNMAAGLDRYRAWLDEHTTEEQARPQAIRVTAPAALRAAFAHSSADIAPAVIGGPVVLRGTTHGSTGTGSGKPADWDADQAVT